MYGQAECLPVMIARGDARLCGPEGDIRLCVIVMQSGTAEVAFDRLCVPLAQRQS